MRTLKRARLVLGLLLLMVGAGSAAVVSPAWATPVPGATYNGTFTAGGILGTVKFRVSSDGRSVTGYEAKSPTQIPGQSDGPFSCTLSGQSVFLEESISDHAFEYSQSDGSFFKGTFPGRQSARGTLRLAAGGGACRSAVLPWTAMTKANPPSPPKLLAVGHVRGRPTARWSVPRGYYSEWIEVSTRRTTGADGDFRKTVEFDTLRRTQRSWRGDAALKPGTYYVHVSACSTKDPDCLDTQLWSNIRKLVVR